MNQTPSVYAMDNWHVTPRLSLQLGLRYDALPHAWERGNVRFQLRPAAFTSPARQPKWNADGSMDPTGPGFQTVGGIAYYLNGIGLAGVNGFPPGLVNNDYKTLQPRIGFSEDLFGNGKTVLRGGFGTFYERMQGNDIYNAATTPPFAYNPSAGKRLLHHSQEELGNRRRGQPFRSSRPASPTSADLQGSGCGAVQPGRAARSVAVGHLGGPVRRQPCLASEHPAADQQLTRLKPT